jgi:hypothetical protein
MRSGDADAWLQHTGKGDGLLQHAREWMGELEPLTWLAALGCLDREHDLEAARRAVQADDEQALRDALGLSRQLVAADLLQAGHSIEVRRAQMQDHFTVGEPPLAVLDSLPPPPSVGDGVLAWHASLLVRQPDRVLRVRVGRDEHGLTDLRVNTDLAGVTRRPAMTDGDLPGAHGPLVEPWLGVEGLRWLRVIEVRHGGGTRVTELRIEPDGQVSLLEDRHETRAQRLAAARDGSLQRLQREVQMHMSTRGRYPESLEGTTTRLVDPTAPGTELGWTLYDEGGPWFELIRTPDPVIRTIHRYNQGHRAINITGQPHWQD